MKKVLRTIFTALMLTSLSVSVFAQIANNGEKKDSIITLKGYNKIIGNKEKAVLVYFSADWCMVCPKMKPLIAQIEKDLSTKMEVLRIDTQRDKEITEEFEIDALPVLMLYKNGSRIWLHFGLLDLKTICSEIEIRL